MNEIEESCHTHCNVFYHIILSLTCSFLLLMYIWSPICMEHLRKE
jgi:hypothetical protein